MSFVRTAVLVSLLSSWGCAGKEQKTADVMKTKTVSEQLGVADFEVPADWKALPSTEDASVQYYPEDADVVLRASALVYDLEGEAKGKPAAEHLEKLSVSSDADRGTTKAGDPWRRTTATDADGTHDNWYVANVRGSRFTVLIFTYSNFVAAGDERASALADAVQRTVDSTRFR